MKEIFFTNIAVRIGKITFDFCEIDGEKENRNNAFIRFGAFKPSNDTIAHIFGSFCGRAYSRIHIDLSLSRSAVNNLVQFTGSEILCSDIVPAEEIQKRSILDRSMRKLFGPKDDTGKKRIILSFSGGMDSLAALCIMPENTEMVAIYFEGFEREYNYFKKFKPHTVRTNLRWRLSIDSNSWTFMGFGAMLYAEYLNADQMVFGTVLESGRSFVDRSIAIEEREVQTLPFTYEGLANRYFIHGLTELGTAMVVAHYMPDEVMNSLTSLADVGSEKLYRKECLINIAYRCYGLGNGCVENMHLPEKKLAFGQYFVTDFLVVCIAKKLGMEYALNLVEKLPDDFQQFIDSMEMNFYARVKPENIAIFDGDDLENYKNRLEDAGIIYYTDQDREELKRVAGYLYAAK